MNTHGFCAGTLVHTDKGLVPIQDIRVGDMVLSKSEFIKENLLYKLVTKTFISDDKEIWALTYFHPIPHNGSFNKEILLVTPDHKIWVSEYEDDVGEVHIVNDWMRVDELYNSEVKGILVNNQIIGLTSNPVLATPDKEIGYLLNELDNDPEYIVQFKNEQVIVYGIKHLTGGLSSRFNVEEGKVPYNKSLIKIGSELDEVVVRFLNYYMNGKLNSYNSRKQSKIYNFTITEYNNYFVEEKGLLVHQ